MRARPDVDLAAELNRRISSHDIANALEPNMGAWSRSIREALGLTLDDVARRMDVSQPAVGKLEQHEATDTNSIVRLSALAGAMDCGLVYGFVPRRSLVDAAVYIVQAQNAARAVKRPIPSAGKLLFSRVGW